MQESQTQWRGCCCCCCCGVCCEEVDGETKKMSLCQRETFSLGVGVPLPPTTPAVPDSTDLPCKFSSDWNLWIGACCRPPSDPSATDCVWINRFCRFRRVWPWRPGSPLSLAAFSFRPVSLCPCPCLWWPRWTPTDPLPPCAGRSLFGTVSDIFPREIDNTAKATQF